MIVPRRLVILVVSLVSVITKMRACDDDADKSIDANKTGRNAECILKLLRMASINSHKKLPLVNILSISVLALRRAWRKFPAVLIL